MNKKGKPYNKKHIIVIDDRFLKASSGKKTLINPF